MHHALGDHATGDCAELRRTEHVTHFGDAEDVLANVTAEHTGERLLDVLDDVVDDVVVAHVQAFGLDDLARAGIGTNVEAEQHRIGRQCQVGIGLGDTTDTATDHAHLHLVVAQAVERPLQRFERTTHVGLEHDVERLLLVLTHGLEDVLELAGVSTGQLHFAELALTEQGDFAGLLLVGDHGEVVTGFRRTVQTKNLHRNGRTGFLHRLAILVEHGPHAAEVHTTQDHITLAQRTVLNQDGGNRATPLVQARFDHHTATRSRRRCLQFKNLGLQQHRFEQLVDTGADLGGNRDERCIAAPLFRNHIQRGQAVLDVVRVGFRLVDLVHRDHDRNTRRLGVLHRFLGLRHDAVVGGHDQNHDIGGLGAACTHGGKRRVARGIKESDHATLGLDVIGTDVLGDTAGFADRHLGTTNVVEQRGLAMVDVTHDGHDRRTGDRLAFELQQLGQLFFQRVVADQLDLVAQFFGDQLSGLLIQHLVNGDRRTHLEHELDDFGRFHRHLLGQFGHSDGLADRHFTHDWSCWALEPMLVTLL